MLSSQKKPIAPLTRIKIMERLFFTLNNRLLLVLFAPIFLLANSTDTSLNYTLDSNASDVTAKVPFFGLSSKTARFPKMEGAVRIVPNNPEAARINVTFDATALEASDTVTLSRLRGEKFFWVEKHPQLRFAGHRLTLTSATKGRVEGQLTARGITQPATLNVTFDTPPLSATPQEKITFTAKTTIDRRKFGMKSYPLIVGNKVKITLRATMLPD